MDYLVKKHGGKIIYFAILVIVIVIALVVWFFFINPRENLNDNSKLNQNTNNVYEVLTEEDKMQKAEIIKAIANEADYKMSVEEGRQKQELLKSLSK